MTISGVSMYDSSLFSSALTTSGTDSAVGGTGKPQGPPPSGGQDPQVDTNDDGYWDSDELETMVDSLNEENGTSLDATDLMSTYDTDGDGYISEEESASFKDDNAFELEGPNMEQAQGMMMSGSMGSMSILDSLSDDSDDSVSGIDSSDELVDTMLEILEEMAAEEEAETESDDTESNSNLVSRAMKAYGTQSSYFDYSILSTYEETAV